jgi:prepilin-type N-terminal cleavage/methylation domain-containing protein
VTERRRPDLGFTLIEVLIVTLLMGVIATAIAAAFIVIVRTAPETQSRDDDARTLLGLTNYLPTDVSSTRGADIQIPGAPTSCGASAGTSLLTLSWTDDASGATTEVNYRFAQDSGWRIVR